MRKPFTLLLLVLLLGLVPLAYATEGDTGYFGSTATSGGAYITTVANSFYASPFALNVDANITALHAYGDWHNYYMKFFIYSNDGLTCYYGGDQVRTTGNVWLNDTAVDIQLEAGVYLLGIRSSDVDYLYKNAGNGMNGTVGFNTAWGSLSPNFNTNLYSVYANYTEAVIVGSGEVTAQMISTDWLTFGGLVFLCVLSVVFILKSRNYLLNFIFGTIVFGAGVALLGTNTVLSGWINLLSIIMGVVCMLDAFMIWRNG